MNKCDLICVSQLSESIKFKLEKYVALLFKWQKAINLVSNNTLDNIWLRHIEDSLQIVPYLEGQNILDIGSGGGFPGMVLAIVGDDKNFLTRMGILDSLDVTCVDSDRRKMTFLSEVARQTSTKVNIIADRIENISGRFDTVTARGFAELKYLVSYTKQYADYGVFLKGKNFKKEIDDANKLFTYDVDIVSSNTDVYGNILKVYNIEELDV